MKSYFLLYQRAKELCENDKVKLTDIKSELIGDTYYFNINEHGVRLHIYKNENKNLWVREWECDCQHFSIWQNASECKHVKAAELFLMNGGINNDKF